VWKKQLRLLELPDHFTYRTNRAHQVSVLRQNETVP
jgi:hypothetical protein